MKWVVVIMTSNQVDEGTKIHYELLAELSNYIYPGCDEYRILLMRCKAYLSPAEIKNAKTDTGNLFDSLEFKGYLNVGNYRTLKELVTDNIPVLNIIEEYEKKIVSISNESVLADLERRHQIDESVPSTSKLHKFDGTHKDNKTEPTRHMSALEKRTALMIDQHRDDKTFVITEAVNKGIEILTEHGMLIYSGLPGDGKTKNALEIMAQYKQSHPDWLFLKFDDVRMWSDIHPDVNSVILFDNCLGSTNTDLGLINDGNKYWPSMHACVEKGKVRIIMTIRKNILAKSLTKLEKYEIFSKVHTIDLTSAEIKLTENVKWNILKHHFDKNGISVTGDPREENYQSIDDKTPVEIYFAKVEEMILADTLIGFPQTCFMFCSKRKYTRLGVNFFRNPARGLLEEIDQLMEQDSNGKIQYCIMAYMFLKGGRIDFNNVDSDMFTKVSKSINLHKTPSKRELNTAKKYLTDTYIVSTGENDIFQFKHQTILESVALCFYNDNPSLLLQLCSMQFIEEFIRPQTYKESEGEIVLRIKNSEYKHLIERFLCSFQQDNVMERFEWWIRYSILDDVQFVNAMMDVIKSDDIYKQMIQNCINNRQLFTFACQYGKTHLIDSLYNLFNVTDTSTKYCLSAAFNDGHTGTVMWLLDNKVGLGCFLDGLQNALLIPTETRISMIKHPNVTLNNLIQALRIPYMIDDHKTFEALLNRWPDIEQRYVLKILYDFFKYGNNKAVDVIIKKRPDVITQEVMTDGFRLACMVGRIDTMNFCLNMKHKNINCKMIHMLQNDENLTNLHIAAYFGNCSVCIKLTELGLRVTDRTKNGFNVLQMAILGYRWQGLSDRNSHNALQSDSVLLSQYVDESSMFDSNVVGVYGHKQLFGFLMDHQDFNKTDLDMTLDDFGRTLAHYCVCHNEPSIIQLLCKKYPRILSVSDKMNFKPIHLAVLLGRSEIFKLLYSMKTVHETDLNSLNTLLLRGRQDAHKFCYTLCTKPEFLYGFRSFALKTFGTLEDYAAITGTIQDNADGHKN